MKKSLTILLALLASMSISFGQFGAQSNVKTCEVNKVKGAFDSFNWAWAGKSTQSNKLYITQGDVGYSLVGSNFAFKLALQTKTGQVAYINTTNISVSTNTLTWLIANTNIPPNNTYQAEIWAYDTLTTNTSRTLAQGQITVFNSLYKTTDSSFPWPVTYTNVADIVAAFGGSFIPWGSATDATARASAAVALTNAHNEFVTWGNVTDSTARASAAVALTNAHNEFTPWGYATDTTARATANTALTNAHDTMLDLAGTRQLSGDLSETPTTWKIRHSNQQDVVTFDHTTSVVLGPLMATSTVVTINGIVNHNGKVITNTPSIWASDAAHIDIASLRFYKTNGTKMFEAPDYFKIYDINGNISFDAQTDLKAYTNIVANSGAETISGFNFSGNGSGLTNVQKALSADVASFATNVPFWSGVGSMYVQESENHMTSILYHVTSTSVTNKIGEFATIP